MGRDVLSVDSVKPLMDSARSLTEPIEYSLCDRHAPGARAALPERPCHYTAKRGSDAAAIRA